MTRAQRLSEMLCTLQAIASDGAKPAHQRLALIQLAIGRCDACALCGRVGAPPCGVCGITVCLHCGEMPSEVDCCDLATTLRRSLGRPEGPP